MKPLKFRRDGVSKTERSTSEREKRYIPLDVYININTSPFTKTTLSLSNNNNSNNTRAYTLFFSALLLHLSHAFHVPVLESIN